MAPPSNIATIRLSVPGTLSHRAIAVRVVAEACRLVSNPEGRASVDIGGEFDLRRSFDAEFVSAFAEIYNNIAIHAYQRKNLGNIEIDVVAAPDGLVVEISDHGRTFDINAVPEPPLDQLPEGGMGIHIARTMLDEVVYQPGPPNRWRLVKRVRTAHHAQAS